MKKTVKGLIIAASVAAVVGVGAVSYAAWSGGTAQSKEIGGTTGSINTIGTLTVTPKADTFTTEDSAVKMKALYPVNQGASYLTYWEFDVEVTGEGDQTVTVKGDITQATGGDAVLYYSTLAPSGAAVADAKNISTAQEITMAASGATKVYVYMTSDKTEAMKATIKLTFEASAASES